MAKILGKATFFGSMWGDGDLVMTCDIKVSDTTMVFGPYYVCRACSNIYQLEPGERRRKYCQDKCRHKIYEEKRKTTV